MSHQITVNGLEVSVNCTVYNVQVRLNILGEQMCAYLEVICISHLLFGVQYIHYMNCRLSVCFKLFIVCIIAICFLLLTICVCDLQLESWGGKQLELQKLIQWPPRYHLMVKHLQSAKEIFDLFFQAKVSVSYFFILPKHVCVTNNKYHRYLLV